MARLKQFWIEIKTSFWFIPAIIIVILIFIAMGVLHLDLVLAAHKEKIPFLIVSLKQESVRTFLATIAGSMMTIAGVVFSITILVLAQTAGQYTSRVLRNFMRLKTNQVILGIFVGIFIFCLVLLTNFDPTNNALTASSGFALALIGVGFLIYYIHQTSISIQATEILRSIQEETSGGIEKLYPKPYEEKETPEVQFNVSHSIFSHKTGYIQAVDLTALLQLAVDFGTQIEITKMVGDFVAQGEEIGLSEKNCLSDDNFSGRFHNSLIIGKYRTAAQDVAYGIQQIVDIALRGLSPGINDLSTTQTAIDYLKSIYIQIGNRDLGSPIYYHEDHPMLFAPIHSFSSFLEIGLRAICANSKNQPTIQDLLNFTLEKIKQTIYSTNRKKLFDYYICPTSLKKN